MQKKKKKKCQTKKMDTLDNGRVICVVINVVVVTCSKLGLGVFVGCGMVQ